MARKLRSHKRARRCRLGKTATFDAVGVLRAAVVATQAVLAAVDGIGPGYNTCVVDTLHYTITTAITPTARRMSAAGAAVLWNSVRPPAIGASSGDPARTFPGIVPTGKPRLAGVRGTSWPAPGDDAINLVGGAGGD